MSNPTIASQSDIKRFVTFKRFKIYLLFASIYCSNLNELENIEFWRVIANEKLAAASTDEFVPDRKKAGRAKGIRHNIFDHL